MFVGLAEVKAIRFLSLFETSLSLRSPIVLDVRVHLLDGGVE